MEPFVWTDRFLTGEPVVDEEHQELVRTINRVASLEASPEAPAEVRRILDYLVRYAVNHFAHEEELMASAHCDPRHVQLHRSVHVDFAKQVVAMRKVSTGEQDTEQLLRFLSNWLAYHILGMDQTMTRQVHNIRRGMTPEAAYELERETQADPATASLLDALNSLYRVVVSRNTALLDLNADLEKAVAERTEALTQANTELLSEQHELKAALAKVQETQDRLLDSERRRAEEAERHMQQLLAQIVDGDPVPTLVINAEHRVTHWNKACANVTGVPASAVIGSNRQWSAFYPNERPLLADLVVDGRMEEMAALYAGKYRASTVIADAYEAEDFFPHFGEGGRWLYFTAAPLRNREGRIIGAIETLQDVTERHRAEESLRDYQAHLEELVAQRTRQLSETKEQLVQSEKLASIGQLAAGVAHEINNPIGYVYSNIGALEKYLADLFAMLEAYEAGEAAIGDAEARARLAGLRQKLDLAYLKEDIPVLVRESKEGITRVKKIVQDLKDFSRVDTTREWQLADLHQGIDSTINIVANEVKYKADVVKEYGDLPKVECVASQLNQVFMNLLVNAAHAMGAERGRITIRTGVSGDDVWLEFADNGSGMPAEVQAKVFDPFFTTKPVGKGTGLGLSLAYGIIQDHRGRIELESEVGKGTTFRITLPVRQSTPAQAAA